MQSRLSYLGNVAAARARRIPPFDSVTEPSGQGDYAEAMRELISELRLGPRGLFADNVVGLQPAEQLPARAQRGHLRLVR